MNIRKLTLVLFLNFFLILFTANAQQNYGVSLNTDINSFQSCPNDAVSYKINIVNIGEFKDSFELETTGDLSERITLSENTLNLEKGEGKIFYLYVNSPIDSGDYFFSLNARSLNGNTEQSLPFILIVNPCYAYNLDVSNNRLSVCDRSYLEVLLTLENQGSVVNSYEAVLEGPVWARLEDADLILNSGEEKQFRLGLAPDYGEAGNYSAALTLIPEMGNLNAYADFNIEVRPCHSVDVEFSEQEFIVCEATENIFNAKIKNTGELNKVYNLSLEAPSWITLENNLLSLDGGEEDNISIVALPTENSDFGIYEVKLKAVSTDTSSVVASDETSVLANLKKINECYYNLGLEIKYNNVVVYADSSMDIPVTVFNNGDKKVDYIMSLSGTGINFSNMNTKEFSLASGENKTISLQIKPNTNVTFGSYYVDVELNVRNGPFLIAKRVNVLITDGIFLPPAPEENVSFFERLSNWFNSLFSREKVTENIAGTVDNLSLDVTEIVVEENESLGAEEVTENQTVSEVLEEKPNIFVNFLELYRLYILAGVVTLVLFVLIIIFLKPYRFSLVIGILALGLLFFLAQRVGFSNFFRLYNLYLIVGTIAAVLFILLIHYWKDVVDFFEDEGKPRRKKK